MHPYKMVKDVRTGVETSDVEGVMAGGVLRTATQFSRVPQMAVANS